MNNWRRTHKLSDEDVEEIIELRKAGWSYPKIGDKFKIDHTSVIYWIKKFGDKIDWSKYQGVGVAKISLRQKDEYKIKVVENPVRFQYDTILEKQAEVDKRKCTHSKRAMFKGECFICGH